MTAIQKKMALVLSVVVLILVFSAYAKINHTAFDFTSDIIIYIIIFLCCLAILVASFLLLFVKEWPITKLFLVAGGAIGLLSLIINTPGSVPDEGAHISNTYLWSNRLLRISETLSDQQLSDVYISYDSYVRKEDLNVINEIVQQDASSRNYKNIIRNLTIFISPEDAKLASYNLRDNSISPIAYFPAILGITIARLLKLGCVPMFYFGKLFMLAFYIIGIYWSIERIPFGKTSIFMISILPMCVNLAPSFSYDSAVITLSMMLIAQILYLAYGKIQRIGTIEVFLSGVLVFLFSPLKVMVYLPIVLLFLSYHNQNSVQVRNITLFVFQCCSLEPLA